MTDQEVVSKVIKEEIKLMYGRLIKRLDCEEFEGELFDEVLSEIKNEVKKEIASEVIPAIREIKKDLINFNQQNIDELVRKSIKNTIEEISSILSEKL